MGQARRAQHDQTRVTILPRGRILRPRRNHVVTDLARYHSSLGPIRRSSSRRRS